MKALGIEIRELVNTVAAKLAHEDADKQAEFLNIFFRELGSACETRYHAEFQCAFIREKMDDNARHFAGCLTDAN